MGMTSRTNTDTPRAWVGSLAAYNGSHDGVPRLIGKWVDAIDAPEVTVAELHAGTGVPYTDDDELWIFDLDGEWPVHREMDPVEAGRWGEIHTDLDDPDDWPAFCAWVRSGSYIAEGDTDYPCIGDFQEAYRGRWERFADYADQLAEDIDLFDGLDPNHVAVRYFDWETWIKDLEMDYVVERATHGGVYVFQSL